MLQDKLKPFIKKFDEINNILVSQDFSTNIKKMTELSKEQSNLEPIVKYTPQKPIEKKPIYDKNDDFLFWIFFIFVKGEMEFEYIKKQKFTVAQEFKINASLKIKKSKFNNRKLVKSKWL